MSPYLKGVSDIQRAVLKRYEPPQLFAVISWGCAATAWTARVLNSHPDIYCVHADNYFWSVLGGVPKLEGVEYMRIIGSQGHAHVAAGDVHGVARHDVPRLRSAFGERFGSAVVVREPMARLRSQVALFAQLSDEYRTWDIGYVDLLIQDKGVTLPDDSFLTRLFVHGANMLNAIIEEREAGKVYRSEDLTRNPAVLGEFVEEVTRSKISPEAGWLESAVRTAKVNPHASQNAARSFSDWQIDVIRRTVRPEAWEFYSQLGYPTPAFL